MKLFTKNIISILILLSLSSCATILNSSIQKISISSEENIKILSVDKAILEDSSFNNGNDTKEYYVLRSKSPIKIDLLADSIPKTIILNPQKSFAYWLNIYYAMGLGMLVDKNSTKRFGYPQSNYLSLHNSEINRKKFAPIKKGSVYLSLSYPFISGYQVDTIDGSSAAAGVLGLNAGLDYFYQDDKYVAVNFGVGTDLFGEYFGPGYRQTTSMSYINLMSNYLIGSFDFGYGLNLSQPKWEQKTMGDTIKMDYSVRSTQLGISLSTHYRLGNYFRIGMLYQPMMLNISPHNSPLNYQHYFSLNLLWKVPLYNK